MTAPLLEVQHNYKGVLRSKLADFYLYLRHHFDLRESSQVDAKSNHFSFITDHFLLAAKDNCELDLS